MGSSTRGFALVAGCLLAVLAGLPARADDDDARRGGPEKVDTQFIFGFTQGAGVGEAGERELEHQTQTQWAKRDRQYLAAQDQLRVEYSPFRDFRMEFGVPVTYYGISGVTGLDDRRQGAFNGFASEFRYRLIDSERAPFALTLGIEPHWARTDEVSGAPVDAFGGEMSIAIDRELVPGRLFVALNLVYDPEAVRARTTGLWDDEATLGIASSLVAQVSPGVFVGAEARYLRKYDGLGCDTLLGDALFIGPNAYVKLSKVLALSGAVGFQVAGHAPAAGGALDLTNFTRQQALLRLEYNF